MLRSLEPSESELIKLCRAKRWEAARYRVMSHPSEASDGVVGVVTLSTSPSPSSSTSTAHNNGIAGGNGGWNHDSSSTPLSIACRGGAPVETVREISLACPDQLLVNHARRGTVLHDCIKHRAPLNVVSYILESQVQWERDLKSDSSTQQRHGYVGSVFDRRDYLGRTPLHHLMERACQWIKSGGETDPSSASAPNRGLPSFYGRWKDRDKMVAVTRILLEAHPDAAAAPDLDGQTPLSIILTIPATNPPDVGVELRILELVRLIIGANPSAALGKCQRVIRQVTAAAQQGGSPGATAAGAGGGVNSPLLLSHTPLSCALSHGRSIVTVRLLLDTAPQAALIPVGSERELPLHVAVTMRAPVELVALLLEAGHPSSAIARDRRSLTPIDWAWVRHVVDHHPDGEAFVKVSKRRYVPTNYEGLADCAVREIEEAKLTSREDVLSNPTMGPFWEKMELLLRAAHHGGIGDDRLGPGVDCAPPTPHSSSPASMSWSAVHAAAAVCCPHPVMTIALAIDRGRSPNCQQARERDEHEKLPLHYCAARPAYRRTLPLGFFHEPHDVAEDPAAFVRDVLAAHPPASRVFDRNLQLPLHVAIESEALQGQRSTSHRDIAGSDDLLPRPNRVMRHILNANVDALERRDGKTRLYPFMQAAAVATNASGGVGAVAGSNPRSFSTCYELLRENPTLVTLGISPPSSSDAAKTYNENEGSN